ncbi:hypothetical protein BDQ12DRAFT_775081 [Crucibulum laeve]|uniref:Uncharacterized protein n=1 Tax=Crucibulum laeve TaxID=68775 RepID=A0A5C3LH85_9AGAR|nr:hypothetical protein BDQ12DRAFT_775081 [Crucibulum laeve]
MSNHEHWASLSTELVQAMLRNVYPVGALVILIWDLILSWNLEYDHIWRHVELRFAPTFKLNINYSLLLTTLAHPPITTNICLGWFYAQMICSQSCLTIIEGVLMLRVYALYNKGRIIGRFLLGFYILETALVVIFGYRTRSIITFDEICTPKEEGLDAFLYGSGVVTTQIVIWVLTINKRGLGSSSERNKHVMNLLIRDGAFAFAVVIHGQIRFSLLLYDFFPPISPMTYQKL